MDTYRPERDIDSEFLSAAARWIADFGEVFVALRYLRAAGSKDFLFCRSLEAFEEVIDRAPRGTDIEVFRDRQLPIRGFVDDDLIARALAGVGDGTEYLVLAPDAGTEYQPYGLDRMGDNHAEMQEDLEEFRGQYVAFGRLPDIHVPDSDRLISRSKGGIDGPR